MPANPVYAYGGFGCILLEGLMMHADLAPMYHQEVDISPADGPQTRMWNCVHGPLQGIDRQELLGAILVACVQHAPHQ